MRCGCGGRRGARRRRRLRTCVMRWPATSLGRSSSATRRSTPAWGRSRLWRCYSWERGMRSERRARPTLWWVARRRAQFRGCMWNGRTRHSWNLPRARDESTKYLACTSKLVLRSSVMHFRSRTVRSGAEHQPPAQVPSLFCFIQVHPQGATTAAAGSAKALPALVAPVAAPGAAAAIAAAATAPPVGGSSSESMPRRPGETPVGLCDSVASCLGTRAVVTRATSASTRPHSGTTL
mmetsp:Transcript_15553/g.48349  ORF Transcript_15553/g.48349 Transcript_15553/m.48349 type:complete len:236 (-) Transcript_15553:644-1351(-)